MPLRSRLSLQIVKTPMRRYDVCLLSVVSSPFVIANTATYCALANVWLPSSFSLHVPEPTKRWSLRHARSAQVGSQDIDSGEEGRSDDAEDSDSGGGGPGSGQVDAEGSEEDEDEVGDLSWEAVMAAVQDGGSDREDDEEDQPETVAASKQAGPEPSPVKAVRGNPRKGLSAAGGGKHGKGAKQPSSQLGKRPRQ